MNRSAAQTARDALSAISNWLVCHAIASPEDMAQSFEEMRQKADDAIAALDNRPTDPPKPSGDGKTFRSVPGDHLHLYGPGEVNMLCHTQMDAEDVWKQLEKAYAHGFEEGRK